MPDSGINVVFRERGAEAVTAKPRQTVALIIEDTKHLGRNVWSRPGAVPDDLTESNSKYIKRAMLGNTTAPARVLVFVTGTGEAPSDGGTAPSYTLQNALDALQWEAFGWLAPPPEAESSELKTIADWVVAHYKTAHFGKAVLPNYATVASEAIVNFTGSGLKADGETLGAADYCSRIAGFLAGTPLTDSVTNAVLPDLTDCTRLSQSDLDAAVDAGKLTVKYRGGTVRLTRGVNSYVPTGSNLTDAEKRPTKIKLNEIRDQAWYDVHGLLETEYEGRYPNNYDNRMIAVTAILDYLHEGETLDLYAEGSGWARIDADATRTYLTSQGVDTTDMSDEEVVRYVDGNTRVYLIFGATVLDSMEDFVVTMEM